LEERALEIDLCAKALQITVYDRQETAFRAGARSAPPVRRLKQA